LESERTQGLPKTLAEEEVFRPWRRESAYAALLVVLAGLLAVFWYVESNQILNSEIALGIDPDRAVKFVSIAIAAATLVATLVALRARQFMLATGELRLSGPTPLAEPTALGHRPSCLSRGVSVASDKIYYVKSLAWAQWQPRPSKDMGLQLSGDLPGDFT
jgi:hypothetical protein